jgi:phosphoglycerate dehydrogenase-like enzyme
MGTDERGKAAGDVVVGVVVADGDDLPAGLEGLSEQADVRLARSDDELAEVAGHAEVLCVWDFRRPRLRTVWPRARRLRWVHAASAGVDAVAFPELAASDVVLTNTRGVLDQSIAEWVLGVMLVFTKDLHTTLALQRRREWRHRDSERLAGRRVVVVGAGSIGRAVARLCRAAGTSVEGVASAPRAGDADFDRVVGPDRLGEVLSGADFVVVCAPLTPATRGMIGGPELAALPAGSRLVNVGRGPVVDEAALLDALRAGRLAGAALDVFDQEPLPADHPFWAMDQVIVSPHMAGDVAGWEEAFSAVFMENFRRWSRGQPLLHVVDKARVVAPVTGS